MRTYEEPNSYIKAVKKHLFCSGKRKKEIIRQLGSDISIALEEGASFAEIQTRKGTPAELAAEFNENIGEEERKKARQAKLWKRLGIAAVILLLLAALLYWLLPKWRLLDSENGDEESEVKARVQLVVELLNAGEYETLREEYAIQEMWPYLTEESMQEIRSYLGADWGEFVSWGNIYVTELSQGNNDFFVADLSVSYENLSVVYRITLDEDLNLAGLYIR